MTRVDDAVLLMGEDLLSKYGFGDGQAIDEILAGAGYDPDARDARETEDREMHTLSGAVLEECVRAHLEPLIGGRAVDYGNPRSHNPIRLKGWEKPTDKTWDALRDVSAWVPKREVLAIAERLAPGYVGARAPAPR